MLKKMLPVFIILLFISSTFIGTVQAQTGPAKDKRVWRCLKAEQVGGKTKRPPVDADVNVSGPKNPGSKFPSDPNTYDGVYIVLVVPPKSQKDKPHDKTKTIQSTGNAEFDKKLFNTDFTGKLAALGLTFELPKGATSNQKVQATDGSVSFQVHLKNAQGHTNYGFYGVTINEAVTTAPTEVSQQSGSTLKYGTIDFGENNTGDPEDCESIRWDPYGRVFDSRSLEPIPEVKVKLLDESKKLFSGFDFPLPNPQTTEADGMFNFPVPPGTYYLAIATKPSTHEFTSNPNLHKNYKKAYSDIYKPDEPIDEAEGKPEHRDIPLDPGTNLPLHFPIEMITYDVVKLGQSTKYEGIVSHPLSKVSLIGKKSKKVYATVDANAQGEWEIILSDSQTPQDEKLVITPKKVDITKLSLENSILQKLASLLQFEANTLVSSVYAQETSPAEAEGQEISVDPILPYIEGYAYDVNGKIIPNAQIKVRVDWSGQVYFETKADGTGFFGIEPKYLPIFAYNLEFISPTNSQSTTMTTSGFVEKNQQYLQENKINLMAVTKDGKSLYPTVPPPTGSENISPTGVPSTNAAQSGNAVLIVVILVLLVVTVGIVIMYMMKKKDMSSPQTPLVPPSGPVPPPQV